MPISYRTDAELKVVFVRSWGDLTEGDLRAVAQAIRADATVSPAWATLTDVRDVDAVRVSGAFLRSYESAFDASARRAVVVPSTLMFGLARMFGLSRGIDDSLQIFSEIEEALDWLGLPADTHIPGPIEAVGERRGAAG